ncbi:MAG: fructose-bisphosphate aldolase class I [Gemmatimonadota bacterium]|nr:fructose-bisphosphate aldolase class I [Gemmatimonadota bacterium]MDH3369161.1 fructose-bisphosphate aldolase class I [Gemmatimonadota bacterium]MDH3477273.1 fructose-bisphosphate aldolase class I [Gemmatimonadota bacterium]MDH3569361.1 fructose-bisphosphate aldolase class I [Gemmatimonadota bacterium]MDH5548648.1 fructose-bisphosphate aldolase class I [Gemmatimonadota bacterium]
MDIEKLATTAQAIVAKGKGILAADESFGTIEKRFKKIGVSSTEENRRAYRELLFTTKGIGEFISGVILFDETLRQASADRTPFPKVLQKAGSIPGIKVDIGAKPLAGFPGEKITEGLDGLRERLAEYFKLGARFTKWRAVITIGNGIPTRFCIDANAHALAQYAALSQEAGLVPIVEPEVLMDGDHSIERCAEVTETTLKSLYFHLHAHRVVLEGTLLKPNMVIAGKSCPTQAKVGQVAQATVDVLRRCVPAAVPGIVFLSGGQSETEATVHLNAMNRISGLPWELSFSYGRALQASALDAWGGKASQLGAAQKAYYHRAKLNGAARHGKYTPAMESAG